MQQTITIRGAREHNLKNISLELPRNKMIVFTGLSGSGKSSLAFDTIFAEGQRRYIESLSAYARQFLGGMQKPDVDEIEGLSPAISIDQKAHSANPRSTVATITEIYDFLRVLFARIGQPHCPNDNHRLDKITTDEMSARITSQTKKLAQQKEFLNNELIIFSPIIRGRKGEYYQLLYDMYNAGFAQARIDGKIKNLKNKITLTRNQKHTIEIIMDKIPIPDFKELEKRPVAKKNFENRLNEALENAVDFSDGLCQVSYPKKNNHQNDEQIFSTQFSCPACGYSFPEIEPRLFSFNSPYGYCQTCHGLGTQSLFSEKTCSQCGGKRLNNDALHVKIEQKNIWQITHMDIGSALEFFKTFQSKLNQQQFEIAGVILNEIQNRLRFMNEVGLHYIELNRKAGTLSGGEAQRIRLASQVGQRLVGSLYVLDEPTIGLHQRDNQRLIDTLRELTDSGNTIIVVEHDEETILASDWIVDIGPGAGVHGGDIVFNGPTKSMVNGKNKTNDIKQNLLTATGNAKKSLTGKYLRREEKIELPKTRRKVDNSTPKLKIKKASENNLKKINIDIPLRRLVCLSGVSGSGKSTLMNDILYRAVYNKLNHTDYEVGRHEKIFNVEYLNKIITINQAPIGRTPRSNPATYTKTFDHIREIFSATPEAKMKGYKPGRFSFNRPGGRCEACHGRGAKEIEMHFLPSVEVTCDVCQGQRFNKETLNIHYKGKNISQVLDLTIEEAEIFFRDIPPIYDKLKILNEVGLDYLTLGQSATTLSGGEAQRIKLSKELSKKGTNRTLYLLDEPTVGLHYEDVKKLIAVLERLVSQGNSVLIIEHNLEILKSADWIIDLGPEGGDGGGELVFQGTPEAISKYAYSHTGKFLKKVLN